MLNRLAPFCARAVRQGLKIKYPSLEARGMKDVLKRYSA